MLEVGSPELLREGGASENPNHSLFPSSLPRMTTSWGPSSCSKMSCNCGHSHPALGDVLTTTSTPWSALVLIVHTNSWDRNTFYTSEEFSAEDFLWNPASRGSVSDCQLSLPLERDKMKLKACSSHGCPMEGPSAWAYTVAHTFFCLRAPAHGFQVQQTLVYLEARRPEPNAHHSMMASQTNVPVSLSLVARTSFVRNNRNLRWLDWEGQHLTYVG